MLSFLKKKIDVPVNNEVKQVDAIQLWYVRWYSRNSEWASGTNPEVEAFPNEEDALAFKTSLENAFNLIRHTSGNKVEITRK